MDTRAITEAAQASKPPEDMRITTQLGESANFGVMAAEVPEEVAQSGTILADGPRSAAYSHRFQVRLEDLFDRLRLTHEIQRL
jgi:hypothetical protein